VPPSRRAAEPFDQLLDPRPIDCLEVLDHEITGQDRRVQPCLSGRTDLTIDEIRRTSATAAAAAEATPPPTTHDPRDGAWSVVGPGAIADGRGEPRVAWWDRDATRSHRWTAATIRSPARIRGRYPRRMTGRCIEGAANGPFGSSRLRKGR